MEMVEMDANLVPLEIKNELTNGVHLLKKWMVQKIWDKEEFRSIIEQADEWDLLENETKEEILNLFNSQEFLTILTATAAINMLDLFANMGAAVTGIQDGITGIAIYLGKLLIAPIIPYALWLNKKVKDKKLKSLSAAIPLAGGIAFPRAALGPHKRWFELYHSVKQAHREAIKSPDKVKEDLFHILKKEIEFPTSYHDNIKGILNAQGLNTNQITLPQKEDSIRSKDVREKDIPYLPKPNNLNKTIFPFHTPLLEKNPQNIESKKSTL